MAILSKIRKLPIIIIILVIGLPLLTFVADPSALTGLFGGGDSVGEVNGEEISRTDFNKELKRYNSQSAQVSKAAFDNLVRTKIYEKQLAAAGITVGEADIFEALCLQEKNSPQFQTQGIFDKSKLKLFLAEQKQNPKSWKFVKKNLNLIRDNLLKTTYNNLVSSGLVSSLKEGELKYTSDNTKLSGKIVYVPFTSIADSTINVSNEEIEAFLDVHTEDYQVKASRDLSFVKFDITPKKRDEDALRNRLLTYLEDRSEYSLAEKKEVIIKGFKNTTDFDVFFMDNDSEIEYNGNKVYFKSTLPKEISENVLNAKDGDVLGPYKEKDFYKLAKVSIISIPDSVKARHILIPFAKPNEKNSKLRTQFEAKKVADSLLTVVKADSSKFSDLAKQFSSDGSASKGGDLGQFGYNTMVEQFRDFCFNNKVGDQSVVLSKFGYHIIRIDNQISFKNAYKLAVFGNKIEASKETREEVLADVQSFQDALSNGKSLNDVAKEKALAISPANGIEFTTEEVPGIGKNREIVNWAFDKNLNIGDVERFDTDKGYVIVTLTDKISKGLMAVKKALPKVKPILIKEKKQKMISDKMTASTLEEIATVNSVKVQDFSDVTLKSPTISGVGSEPNVIAGLLYAKKNQVIKSVVGEKGVFAVKLVSRTAPIKLVDYNTERRRITRSRKSNSYQLYNSLKKSANVVNNVRNN